MKTTAALSLMFLFLVGIPTALYFYEDNEDAARSQQELATGGPHAHWQEGVMHTLVVNTRSRIENLAAYVMNVRGN